MSDVTTVPVPPPEKLTPRYSLNKLNKLVASAPNAAVIESPIAATTSISAIVNWWTEVGFGTVGP